MIRSGCRGLELEGVEFVKDRIVLVRVFGFTSRDLARTSQPHLLCETVKVVSFLHIMSIILPFRLVSRIKSH